FTVPLDEEGATRDVHGDPVIDALVQPRGNDGRTCSGSAGERLADAALPDAHLDAIAVEHPDYLEVGAVRKERVMLDGGAGTVEVVLRWCDFEEGDCVRVAH